jgi:hypothetical protein
VSYLCDPFIAKSTSFHIIPNLLIGLDVKALIQTPSKSNRRIERGTPLLSADSKEKDKSATKHQHRNKTINLKATEKN